MSIGDHIISEIIKQDMIRPDGNVLIWSGNAAEQLDALVEFESDLLMELRRENSHLKRRIRQLETNS